MITHSNLIYINYDIIFYWLYVYAETSGKYIGVQMEQLLGCCAVKPKVVSMNGIYLSRNSHLGHTTEGQLPARLNNSTQQQQLNSDK